MTEPHPHEHQDDHEHFDPELIASQEFWDQRYSGEPVWSGNVNPVLAEVAGRLQPGTAFDMGCGEGGDALWLAARGWTVTGADVSPVVLARCAAEAERRGLADRTRWQHVDALVWEPTEQYDLVSAQFAHLLPEPRKRLHRRLAQAVRPGGTLLVVGHHVDDMVAGHRPFPREMFPTAEEMAAVLDPAQWEIDASAPQRQGRVGDGELTTLTDAVLRAVRR
jgi:SAM-dependent methyltransferase